MISAPLPSVETSEPNLALKNKKSFKIISNNITYILSLSYDEKIILFEIEKEGEFPKKEYNLLLNLEQLYKIDKYFNQFEAFADIQTSFETLIEMKKLTIISNESEKEMKINIINPLNKKEFNIDIPLKEKTLKNEIDSIITYITSLKAEINNIKNRISTLENKVDVLYSKKEELKNKQDKLLFSKSNIIQENDEYVILSFLMKNLKNFSYY